MFQTVVIPVNATNVIDVADVDKVITLSHQNHCTMDVTKQKQILVL